jgi:hypothetical protein
MFSKLTSIFVCALLVHNVVSHPGHDPSEEIAERAAYLNQASRRSLAHCTETLKTRGIHKRAHARRSALAKNLREKRGLAQGSLFCATIVCSLLTLICSSIPTCSRPHLRLSH